MTTFMQWLAALRADAESVWLDARLASIPMWMLEWFYEEGTDANVESIILYCETEQGRNYVKEAAFKAAAKKSQLTVDEVLNNVSKSRKQLQRKTA